jgi:endonuclease/exonuclease/phosphatase family metal-dependent hydrolase
MKVATYNILKGGSQRVHWARMIEDFGVDLLLVQESYPHHEHLPPLTYLDAGQRSAWEMAEENGWGSAAYSRSGSVKPVAVPNFSGWVVGAEISGASWRDRLESCVVLAGDEWNLLSDHNPVVACFRSRLRRAKRLPE